MKIKNIRNDKIENGMFLRARDRLSSNLFNFHFCICWMHMWYKNVSIAFSVSFLFNYLTKKKYWNHNNKMTTNMHENINMIVENHCIDCFSRVTMLCVQFSLLMQHTYTKKWKTNFRQMILEYGYRWWMGFCEKCIEREVYPHRKRLECLFSFSTFNSKDWESS